MKKRKEKSKKVYVIPEPRDKFTPVKHRLKWLPKKNINAIIVGRSGAGKTFLLRHIIPGIKHVTDIILLGRNFNPTHEEIKKYAEKFGISFHRSDNPNEGRKIIEDVVNDSKYMENVILLIFDDFYERSRIDPFSILVNQSYSQLRNQHVFMISIAQDYKMFDTVVRQNCNLKITFQQGNKHSVFSFKNDMADDDLRNTFSSLYNNLKYTHGFIVYNSENNSIWKYDENDDGPVRVF